MKTATLKNKLQQMSSQKSMLAVFGIGMLVSNLFLAYDKMTTHESVVLTPPNLSKPAKVAFDKADANYFEPFTLYIISTISSATPATVDYIADVMESFYTPEVWATVKPQLMAIKTNPKYTGLNSMSYFMPTKAIVYEPDSKKFFVTGKLTSSAYSRGSLQALGSVQATYELQMEMVNGMPKVTDQRAYTGEPMTKEWIRKNPQKVEKRLQDMQLVTPAATEAEISNEFLPTEAPATSAAPEQPVQAVEPNGQIDGVEPPQAADDLL